MGLLCILDRGIQICCDLLSTLLDVADPISLDVLVQLEKYKFLKNPTLEIRKTGVLDSFCCKKNPGSRLPIKILAIVAIFHTHANFLILIRESYCYI